MKAGALGGLAGILISYPFVISHKIYFKDMIKTRI